MLGSAPHKRIALCQQGSIAVIAALVITVLALGAGIAVDYGSMVSRHSTLQTATDAAAIAVARELALANTGQTELEAVANNMVSAKEQAAGSTWTVSVSIAENASSVQITIREDWAPIFAHLLSDAVTPITTTATAKLVGSGKICVLTLDDTSSAAISLTKKAKLEANSCGVYSSTSYEIRFIHTCREAV